MRRAQTPDTKIITIRRRRLPTTRRGFPTPAPGLGIPRVIPIEPLPGQLQGQTPTAARPKVIQLRRDSTGLVPALPSIPTPRRSNDEVARDVSNLIEKVQEPEAEIGLGRGRMQGHPDQTR